MIRDTCHGRVSYVHSPARFDEQNSELIINVAPLVELSVRVNGAKQTNPRHAPVE